MARILIMTPQLPYPPHQGTTLRNFNLIAGLAAHHTVDLLSFITPDQNEAVSPDGSQAGVLPLAPLATYCRHIVIQPAPERRMAQRARDTLFNALPDMALRLATPAMHASLTRLLRENEYDVIQVEGIEMAPYVVAEAGQPRPLRALTGACLVFEDHNAEYLLQQRAFLTDIRRPRRWPAAAYSWIQWRKLATYEQRICRTADRVVAVSEVDRRALQRLLPGLEVTVVPNGVDLDFYQPGIVAPAAGLGPHALVFTGKMDYRPNVDAATWFVDAVLPLVLARVPDARFWIVGQQPHARVAALAAHASVTVTGRVPDVRPYIAGAGVYVVPLRIGGGTRLKVLEAMAMGAPIVSTDLGCDGFPFQDGREVRLVSPPAAFADAIVALLADRSRARELGLKARAYVEAHYGWGTIIPLLEGLYS